MYTIGRILKKSLGTCMPLTMFALTALVISSCAINSSITSSWRDPGFKNGTLSRIFVLVRHDLVEVRSQVEHSLVANLEKKGVSGIASLDVLAANDTRKRTELEALFDSLHIDGIMIVRQVGKEELTSFVPETTYYEVYDSFFDDNKIVKTTTEGGYWEKSGELYKTKVNLYDNSSDRLVWQCQSETVYDGDLKAAVNGFAGEVIGNLAKTKLLAPAPNKPKP